ncbi:MAG: 4-hydroxythreonine-4-phosphate dehydrogenase PdxA [Elusimicrobiota bacterium]
MNTIIITMGEPAGIGPEISLKAAVSAEINKECIPVIIGDIGVLKQGLKISSLEHVKLNEIKSHNDIVYEKDTINVFYPELYRLKKTRFKAPDNSTALASFHYLEEAVRLVRSGLSNAIVTAPISKDAWVNADLPHSAHTEALAVMTDTEKFGMIFVNPQIKVILVTRHVPIKDVSENINVHSLNQAMYIGIDFLNSLGYDKKNIGVCGLNPHAGDNGVLGKEEIAEIKPVIDKFISEDVRIIGPYSADSIFKKALDGNVDIVVAMYHDQGILPLKVLSYYKCVNITHGLPFVRTSPGQGVALDIAGKGIANPESMIEAVTWANKLLCK